MRFKRRNLEITPPFVSLADVAFNLVLFFLIFAKTRDDRQIEWKPAEGTGTSKQVGKAKASIIIDKDQKVYFNGKEVSTQQLASLVTDTLGDAPAGNRLVLLKIDKEAPAAKFEAVIQAVNEAGGETVHVLKDEKPPT